MSELKAYIGPAPDEKGLADYYLKSEADKVINELEADKLELRQRVNVLEGRLFGLSQSHNVETYTCGILERKIIRLERKIKISDKQLRHSNHKRCLAMAEWCNANCMHTVLLIGHKIMPHWEWRIKTNYWYKWRKIWLALAEEPTWTKFLQLIHKEATNAVDKSNA